MHPLSYQIIRRLMSFSYDSMIEMKKMKLLDRFASLVLKQKLVSHWIMIEIAEQNDKLLKLPYEYYRKVQDPNFQ